MRHRTVARKLDHKVDRGDHVVFMRVAWAANCFDDLFEATDPWLERGVSFHFVDLNIEVLPEESGSLRDALGGDQADPARN
jgi:hypothetical protein